MASTKPKSGKAARTASFSDYKAMKDEIIDISEQRFENILTRRLKEFKDSLLQEIENRFEPKFDSLEKRMTFLTWFLPVFLSLMIFVTNFLMKK